MKKYEVVENWVKTGIRSGRFLPGDQLPSESQIAEELSVARNSVRQAIANLNSEGVVETRNGVGTFCLAPGHATTGSRDIGLLCFSTSIYIFPELVDGVQRTLNRSGYHLLLNQSGCDIATERAMLETFRQRGVAGIILEPAFRGEGTSNADLLEDFVRAGVPVVLLDNNYPGYEFSAVVMDDENGGVLAASHLYERGHRRIAVTFDADYAPKIARKDAAIRTLSDRAVNVPAAWQLSYGSPFRAGKLHDDIARIVSDPDDRPTAFLCSSDEEAGEVVATLHEVGLRVPEDVSVIGFDNSPLAHHGRVPLTTIDHPTAYMAELATSILIERIRYPQVDCRTLSVVKARLVERESVLNLRSSERSRTTDKEEPYASQRS